jgi:hypothetical protein
MQFGGGVTLLVLLASLLGVIAVPCRKEQQFCSKNSGHAWPEGPLLLFSCQSRFIPSACMRLKHGSCACCEVTVTRILVIAVVFR